MLIWETARDAVERWLFAPRRPLSARERARRFAQYPYALARDRIFARTWQWLGALDDVVAAESLSPRDLLPAGATSFTRQQSPLGLGHAVWCARDIIGNEPFAVLLPDVLVQAQRSCLGQMIDV